MGDRMPNAEEFAAAAKELADAREAQKKAELVLSNARAAYSTAQNRTERAADDLRKMTDRIAPPPPKGVAVG
jgi:hypothetical protein